MKLVEILLLDESGTWINPAHVVAVENYYTKDTDEWDGCLITMVTGRVFDCVEPITDLMAKFEA